MSAKKAKYYVRDKKNMLLLHAKQVQQSKSPEKVADFLRCLSAYYYIFPIKLHKQVFKRKIKGLLHQIMILFSL